MGSGPQVHLRDQLLGKKGLGFGIRLHGPGLPGFRGYSFLGSRSPVLGWGSGFWGLEFRAFGGFGSGVKEFRDESEKGPGVP